MEYVILIAVASLAAIALSLCISALIYPSDAEDRLSDDERLDSIRGELEKQTAPWRPHVRGTK